MQRDAQWNQDLLDRVNDGVAAGGIAVVREADGPQAFAVEQMVANLQQGRALLDGMTVYRGAKDPEVDAGTFGAQTKHATPVLAIARGYAESSNEHIGLRCPATRGVGVLAEYALPEDVVFHRNFGLEAQADPSAAKPGMTRREAEDHLRPLVEAFVVAHDAPARDAARLAVDTFCARELYELALPAACAPTRQFVVQSDDAGRSRLLAHQDSGPLGDILVDVVRARKTAVDAYHADKLLAELTRGGRSGFASLDALQPGLSQVYADVARQVTSTIGLRQEADARQSLGSLSEALVWRRQAQRDIHMAQLTNSGIVIEHRDPAMRRIAALRPALDKVESGVAAARWLGEREPVLRQLRKASTAATQLEAAATELATTEDECQRAESTLAKWQAARDTASAQHRQIHGAHSRQLQRNFIQRLWYRWRAQTGVETNLQRRAEALRALNARLKAAMTASRQATAAREAAVTRRTAAHEALTGLHADLSARRANGELAFLGDAARPLDKRALPAQEWVALAKTAESGALPLMAAIREAQGVAAELTEIGHAGLAPADMARRRDDVLAELGLMSPAPDVAPRTPVPAPQVAPKPRRVEADSALELG